MRIFTSKRLILVLIVLGLFWTAVLWKSLQDEPLTASAQEQLAYPLPQVDPRQNAYVALVGFGAPADGDIFAAGQAAIEQTNEQAINLRTNIPQGPDQEFFATLNAPKALLFSGPPFKNPCNDLAATHNCLQAVAAQSDAIAQALQQNAILLERYRLLQQLPVFAHTSAPTIDMSPYREIAAASNLLSAAAILDIQRGRVEQGLDFFQRDISFYRNVLAGENTLISAMIARHRLMSHYHALSNLIADPAFPAARHAVRLRALFAPFAQKDKNLHAALSFERRFVLETFTRMDPLGVTGEQGFMQDMPQTGKAFFSRFVFKKNMSANTLNAFWEQTLARTDALTETSLPDALRNPPRPENMMFDIAALYRKHGLLFWRNYFGEVLVNVASPNYVEYIAAIYDMATYAHLVDAQLQLRIDNLPPDDIPARLQQSAAVFLNPYTGRPFDWRITDNALSFEPLAERTREQAERPILTARLPL